MKGPVEITDRRTGSVLIRAVDAIEAAGIDYALMGGLASAVMGRLRHTHDIDLFVRPETAEAALERLREVGFQVERTDPAWLYKAFWDGLLVDVIFTSKGGVLLDQEMREHRRPIEVQGRKVMMLSPEDMLVIKALTNAEHVPRHWHDGLGIIAGGGLDWVYLLRRARGRASRVLSLLLYAVSDGLEVPAGPMRELFEEAMSGVEAPARSEADQQLAARVRQALATDPRVNEPHVSVMVSDGDVVVRGQVATPARRRAIDAVLSEMLQDGHARNDVEVT